MYSETKYVHPNGTQGSHHWKKFQFFFTFYHNFICIIPTSCDNLSFYRIFLSQFYMYYCKTMMFKQLWYYCGILYYNNWRYNKVWNLTENRNWRYEIWPKNALLASKHDVPLGCTSLVVSNHFSEFLYGIYRQALTLI